MYNPIKDGIDKSVRLVSYIEESPPSDLLDYVHCFWELKTLKPLNENFVYHILPDACVNLLFDQSSVNIAAITALQMNHKKLDLGKQFHYVGVQLIPGVWNGDPSEIKSDLVDSPYLGELSLVEVNKKLLNLNFNLQKDILSKFVFELIDKQLIRNNELIAEILKNFDDIQSISDIAGITGLSTRQLQRRIKEALGITPHDFLKILRVHQSFKHHYLDYYTDQSHFIHSFRKITGFTPDKYNKKFDV